MLLIGFFTYIKYILTGNNSELEKIRLLNAIYKSFKSSKYKYIGKDKIITNLFLSKIYALYQSTLSYKQVLESTIFSSDEKRSQLFLHFIIESNLPKEIAAKKDKFTKEAIWQKIMDGENPHKTIKALESEFNMYKNYFSRYNMPKFESEYHALYKFYNLATFNFETFFSKFDSSYSKLSNAAPSYTPVNGSEILNDLKDVYFLIASLPQKIDTSNILSKLFERTTDSDAKVMTKNSINSINSIYKMALDDLSPDKIMNLCRFISEDIRLKINVEQKQVSILDKFRKETEDRFTKTKDVVLEKYSEQTLLQDIKALFKGQDLLKIKGYNEEVANSLDANNYTSIAGIQAFRITKTFIMVNYETNIKETVNTLILEGFFTEKEYQTQFSNIFFAINELKEHFLEQEEIIANSGSYSLRNLQMFLTKATSSNDAKVIKTIETINEKIHSANKKVGELFYNFGNKIFEILQDYKSQKPVRITNIKTLKGMQNKEFIGRLVNCYNDIAKYIKIIKTYVVIDSAVKK